MAYNPKKHHRKSVRLKGYDYASEGLYFITIVCQNKRQLFGYVENEELIFNDAGKHANQCWLDIPNYFPNINLHAHQIMPNHMHGIIEITYQDSSVRAKNISHPNKTGKNISIQIDSLDSLDSLDSNIRAKSVSPLPRSPVKTVGSVVRGFKTGVTMWFRLNHADKYPIGTPIWQRSFHDHIIRDDSAYQNISNYILNNPKKWEQDKFNHSN
jgi:REP element-mobilizing transposase RayT